MEEEVDRGDRVLILGGARAGKSDFAIHLAAQMEMSGPGSVCFIATAEALDDEMRQRIARHRSERSPQWITIEEPIHLDAAVRRAAGTSVIVVDCITLLTSNWMLRTDRQSGMIEELSAAVDNALALAAASSQTLIFVSNEVGLGLVPDTPLGREFRDTLGRINQRLAHAADTVYFLVAGLPIRIKPR